MNKSIEAIKLAIEVFGGGDWHDEIVDTDWADKANNAITVLREALAEQPAQPLTDDKYEAIVEDLAYWGRYVEVDTAHQSLKKHVREVLTAHGITKGNT